MTEKFLNIENLSHSYGNGWAIKDINFEVESNEVVGLLGSNGAGKSTTMNILCGVLNQTKGHVFINGIDLRKNPIEAKKNIGFLPQKPPLYVDLTVKEYLVHCAHLRLVEPKHVKKYLDEALSKCNLHGMKNRLIRNLSGGYQQRVGIAQCIIHKPKLVVLDEPTTGLDPNNIAEIRTLIKEIAENRAVILCTHILPEVQSLCGTVKMIEKGSMVFSDTIDSFNDYVEPDTLQVTFEQSPIEKELLAINGVNEIKEIKDKTYRLGVDTSINVANNLVLKSVDKGWQLSEVYMEKQSLDLIFAHLSGKVQKQ